MDEPTQPTSEKKPFWPTGTPGSAPPAPPVQPGVTPVVPPSATAPSAASSDDVAINVGSVAAESPSIPPLPPASKPEDFREKMKPVMENAKTAAVTAASQAKKMAEQGARNAWPVIEPFLKRCWLNLRVWVPQLANPDFRARQVVYHASDVLSDGYWNVELARQCWLTGKTDTLAEHKLELPVRSHENPLQIVLATVATLMVLFLLWWFFSLGGFILWIVAGLIGYAVLRLKSWPEHVRVTYWASPEAGDAMPAPEVVAADGRLTVVTVDKRLAEATRKSIAAKRAAAAQARAAGFAPAAPPTRATMSLDDRPTSAPAHDPTLGTMRPRAPEPTPPTTPLSNYKRDELPPLKLDD
ncbi:MAG: hypothetical protein JNM18_09200 [Planctomycetaceae bacterium]|nr:hypothetical protein [Planctomycetaceae bacterium]